MDRRVKEEKPIHEQIKDFCKKENLPDHILKKILKISSDSYILGSNDCYRITKDHFELNNKQ